HLGSRRRIRFGPRATDEHHEEEGEDEGDRRQTAPDEQRERDLANDHRSAPSGTVPSFDGCPPSATGPAVSSSEWTSAARLSRSNRPSDSRAASSEGRAEMPAAPAKEWMNEPPGSSGPTTGSPTSAPWNAGK